ncbi:MAG TPA: ubiquitin-like small modifier protein 1 [Chloroflexota bacterium]|nr:ubiquitin-like small modifier protein 1 [Chloroflexota bacterium]
MSTVRVPPVLRSQTGGAKEVQAEGATVGEVLQNLAERHPALQDQLFQDGKLQRFVNVYVNNQDIQYLQSLETPVSSDDTVIILPAMAGGAG